MKIEHSTDLEFEWTFDWICFMIELFAGQGIGPETRETMRPPQCQKMASYLLRNPGVVLENDPAVFHQIPLSQVTNRKLKSSPENTGIPPRPVRIQDWGRLLSGD